MSRQLGGQSLGSFALAAGGQVVLPFYPMPDGHIATMYLTIGFSAKSSGAAFTAVVSTGSSAASEGTDDLDLLLNALFPGHSMYYDASTDMFVNHSSAQARTLLGLTQVRDFAGNFTNGVSIPISSGGATAFNVVIAIPISLQRMFAHGKIFGQGSARMKTGRYQLLCGASLTPSVVLANGTAVLSVVTATMYVKNSIGDPGDIGPTFNSTRVLSQPTVPLLDSQIRLALLDILPAGTNATTSYNINDLLLVTPAVLQAEYQDNQFVLGGAFDVTARCTPLLWTPYDRNLLDFTAVTQQKNYVQATSGVTSISYYDITMRPTTSAVATAVATHVGGGGSVALSHPSPLPPGTAIPSGLSALFPTRISSGARAPSGSAPSTPAAAGAAANTKTSAMARVQQLLKMGN
jgi:hypothetical protein